jgi:hypothetical protein
MGLPVVASDIEAHREFGVETANTLPLLLGKFVQLAAQWSEQGQDRTALIEPWNAPLTLMNDTIEADLRAAGPVGWFRCANDVG